MLNTMPISSLSGVGAVQKKKLSRIGLHTVYDLLLHLPLRYEDRTRIYQIGDLLSDIYATVKGKVIKCKVIFGRRKMMICQISDGSGILTMCFFNFSIAMTNSFSSGRYVLAYGKVKFGKYGAEMIHPEYHINENNTRGSESKNTLTPIYPTTNGVNQATLRKLTKQALDLLNIFSISELLPSEFTQDMMSLSEALRILHRPPSSLRLFDLEKRYHPARRRLIFEELLAYSLYILVLRAESKRSAQPITLRDDLKKNF